MLRSILFLGLLLNTAVSVGQTNNSVQENRIYKKSIYTVLCYNSKQEQSFPILNLGSGEELILEFDELGKSNANYHYSIEHCTSDWKVSPISRLDYLEGFSSDRITDYKLSFNTIQPYTHYQIKLPNAQMRPKIAGNYILKVFENGKEKTPILTQRFYITNNLASVSIDVVPSDQVTNRNSHQKVNFTFTHPFPIANPNFDLRAIVMQNFDENTVKTNLKPIAIRNGSMVYNDMTLNDFSGGSEFRKFDTRTLRFKGINIQDIFRDTTNSVILGVDDVLSKFSYTSQFDENGNFFIKNQDGRNSKTDADYAHIFFRLKSQKINTPGKAYVVGRFNNYTLSPENELIYNDQQKAYLGNLFLKQGLYDYRYVWVTADKKADMSPFEGSFYETENTYQVFMYYKKPGARWEELIAYANTNTTKR